MNWWEVSLKPVSEAVIFWDVETMPIDACQWFYECVVLPRTAKAQARRLLRILYHVVLRPIHQFTDLPTRFARANQNFESW